MTIIAGSRSLTDPCLIDEAVEESGLEVRGVVVGGAPGIDELAEAWAKRNGFDPLVRYADWDRYGRAAGVIRNGEMARVPGVDSLIAIWAGSPGTANMISIARSKGFYVYVHEVRLRGTNRADYEVVARTKYPRRPVQESLF